MGELDKRFFAQFCFFAPAKVLSIPTGWFGLGVTGTGWSMLVSADLGKPLLDKVKELSGALVCCIKDGFGFGLLIS